jgi:probable HAF family extracellular repeat protein
VWRDGSAERLVGLGGKGSYGLGINDKGAVTGGAVRSDGRLHAFLSFNGSIVDIGTLGGGAWSAGYDVNGKDQVVGVSETGASRFTAFRWAKESGMRALLGPGGATNTRAFAANASGTAVGVFLTSSGYFHAAMWDNDGLVTDLGAFGKGHSFAYGINEDGSVVGYSYDALGRQRAFLWTGGMLFDLNNLLGLEDWSLTAAYDINARGQIVGSGYYKGQNVAFRLNPVVYSRVAASEVPEPATFLVGIAVLAISLHKLKGKHPS